MEELRKDLQYIKEQIDRETLLQESGEAQALIESIDPVLASPGELSFKHHRLLAKKLKKAIDRFEVAHPRLISELEAIVHSLSESGI